MHPDTHHAAVLEQYDSRAQAYLSSAVHAQGEDLESMAALVGPRPGAIALDMGCGGGHVAFRLAGLVDKVVAYDLSAAMLETVAAEAGRRGLGNIVTKQGAAEALFGAIAKSRAAIPGKRPAPRSALLEQRKAR